MNKFKGSFNWYGEIHTLWTTTGSKKLARRNLLVQLSKRLNRTVESVMRHYHENGLDNYMIEEVIE